MESLVRDGNVRGWVNTAMGDASSQKVSAIREKIIEEGNILTWTTLLAVEHLGGFYNLKS
jgi:hypothetical protein